MSSNAPPKTASPGAPVFLAWVRRMEEERLEEAKRLAVGPHPEIGQITFDYPRLDIMLKTGKMQRLTNEECLKLGLAPDPNK